MILLLACPGEYVAPKPSNDPPPSTVTPPVGEPTTYSDGVESIVPTVKRHRGEIERCTEVALRTDPKLSGRVAVGWKITEGVVSDAHLVGNETGNTGVGACIVQAVAHFRFDEGVTGEVPSYTWILSGE